MNSNLAVFNCSFKALSSFENSDGLLRFCLLPSIVLLTYSVLSAPFESIIHIGLLLKQA